MIFAALVASENGDLRVLRRALCFALVGRWAVEPALPRADDAARCVQHSAAFGTLVVASFYRLGIAVAWHRHRVNEQFFCRALCE